MAKNPENSENWGHPENPEANPNDQITDPAELRGLAWRHRRRAAGIIAGFALLGGGLFAGEKITFDSLQISDHDKGVLEGFCWWGNATGATLLAIKGARKQMQSARSYSNQAADLEETSIQAPPTEIPTLLKAPEDIEAEFKEIVSGIHLTGGDEGKGRPPGLPELPQPRDDS